MTVGYTPKRRTFVLEFDDPEFDGLEVRARAVPVGQFLDIVGLADAVDAGGFGELTQEQTVQAFTATANLLSSFADVLVDWNVENEDGSPVPATLEGLRQQEFTFVMQIIRAWMAVAAGASDPLGPASNDGAQSVEVFLPMETLSASQAS